MRIYNNYILTVALLLLVTTPILVAMGQNSLEVFYTVFIIEALVVTELYVYLSGKVRRQLNLVSVILFGNFSLIVLANIVKLLV
ncbi:MAG: hypothetical protein IIB13_05100 [Chloroflexi bacterium]|nr:hypothetical protein [Chloroflexota bacterium]